MDEVTRQNSDGKERCRFTAATEGHHAAIRRRADASKISNGAHKVGALVTREPVKNLPAAEAELTRAEEAAGRDAEADRVTCDEPKFGTSAEGHVRSLRHVARRFIGLENRVLQNPLVGALVVAPGHAAIREFD